MHEIDGIRTRLQQWVLMPSGYGELTQVKDDVRGLLDSWAAADALNRQYQQEREAMLPIRQGLRDLTGSTQELTRRLEQLLDRVRDGPTPGVR